MRFVVRQESAGWRWELHNEFGEVLCRSATTFKTPDDAINALKAVRHGTGLLFRSALRTAGRD